MQMELGARLEITEFCSFCAFKSKMRIMVLLSAITEDVVPLRSVSFAMRQYTGLCFLLKSNYPHKTEPCMRTEALQKKFTELQRREFGLSPDTVALSVSKSLQLRAWTRAISTLGHNSKSTNHT